LTTAPVAVEAVKNYRKL
jgi:hypothetical protein